MVWNCSAQLLQCHAQKFDGKLSHRVGNSWLMFQVQHRGIKMYVEGCTGWVCNEICFRQTSTRAASAAVVRSLKNLVFPSYLQTEVKGVQNSCRRLAEAVLDAPTETRKHWKGSTAVC